MIEEGACPAPTFVKMDVEGSEDDALAGLISALPPSARLLIAMHDRASDARCVELLRARSFECHASRALTASRRGEWSSDPDLFSYGPTADVAHDLRMLHAAGF